MNKLCRCVKAYGEWFTYGQSYTYRTVIEGAMIVSNGDREYIFSETAFRKYFVMEREKIAG